MARDKQHNKQSSAWRAKWKSLWASCVRWLLREESAMSGCCSRIPDAANAAAWVEIDGHYYLWIYDADLSQIVKRVVGLQAKDPKYPITWFDAEDITRSMTMIELQHMEKKAGMLWETSSDADASHPTLNYEANRLRGLID